MYETKTNYIKAIIRSEYYRLKLSSKKKKKSYIKSETSCVKPRCVVMCHLLKELFLLAFHLIIFELSPYITL